jgi:tetratricopeptide (TPR) repeat protein
MSIPRLWFPARKRGGFCCLAGRLLAVAIALLAANILRAESPRPELGPEARRNVQAVALPLSTVDGQASWIIEPDVPRIPKIAGLDAQLPPHIERRLSYAFDLAQRGATYSANAEFRAVLGLCALELDSREGTMSRREALRRGWTALDEADEFGGDQREWLDTSSVRSTAAGHTTPVLDNRGTPTDSVQAVQAYYSYAGQQLTSACRGLPGASLAFYGLARTCVVPGTHVTHAAGKAALLQRVALAIAPQNVLAGNELGVLLAQHGHLEEAENMFRQCVALNATPEAWRNLAIVYDRKGDEVSSQAALKASGDLAGGQPDPAMPTDIVASAGETHHIESIPNVNQPNAADRKPGMFTRLNSAFRNPFRR